MNTRIQTVIVSRNFKILKYDADKETRPVNADDTEAIKGAE